jgi:hypothetical protein
LDGKGREILPYHKAFRGFFWVFSGRTKISNYLQMISFNPLQIGFGLLTKNLQLIYQN